MVGLETAELLANHGKAVDLVARSELARDFSMFNKPAMLDKVAMAGVITHEFTTIEEITPEGANVTINGKTRFFKVDTIILAIGYDADTELAESLKQQNADIHVIGDANGHDRFREAIIEGHEVGRNL